jgi:hypothetical protein
MVLYGQKGGGVLSSLDMKLVFFKAAETRSRCSNENETARKDNGGSGKRNVAFDGVFRTDHYKA